ncbi:L-histidine N(alpha)-methyltransferase [Pseudoxanthomonas sp. UTMC 1351]|uniref:L-histidine N(alpha)-methyltransferase n=1 Tax=Pseudoxanthomonas sp. UTMC 1351 TaxID=2695853 RepID=UPI0034CF86BA
MNAAIPRPRMSSLTDLQPPADGLLEDVLSGLSRSPKRIPSKYFYDHRGSELFEAITRQPEYYLTRVEQALLDARMPAIADAVGTGAHVVEYGSGSGRKTRQLLRGLRAPVAYTPVEISPTALEATTTGLMSTFPFIEMLPVCADFTRSVPLPRAKRPARRTLVFFPGSTLGNFTHDEAVDILTGMRHILGQDGRALIGIDLQKDPALIEAAYNDAAGVTAEFTLNLLVRLNRELGCDFDLAGFRHCARYVREQGRIETFLVSLRAQEVHVAGRAFRFGQDEAMRVEYSHKYSRGGFAALAAAAGLAVAEEWNDPKDWFGLRLLRPV